MGTAWDLDADWRLRRAVDTAQSDEVTRQLDSGANVNAANAYGNTALTVASLRGNDQIVQDLLSHGADPDATNATGQTPLMLAAARGHTNVAELLIQAGCQLNKKTNCSGMTALHLATKNKHSDVIRLLLRHGADHTILDNIDKPAVFYANDSDTLKSFSLVDQRTDAVGGIATRPKEDGVCVPLLEGTEAYPKTHTHKSTSQRADDQSSTKAAETMGSPKQKGEKKPKITTSSSKKNDQKKITDQKMEYSEEFHQRMKRSVFDRLARKK